MQRFESAGLILANCVAAVLIAFDDSMMTKAGLLNAKRQTSGP